MPLSSDMMMNPANNGGSQHSTSSSFDICEKHANKNPMFDPRHHTSSSGGGGADADSSSSSSSSSCCGGSSLSVVTSAVSSAKTPTKSLTEDSISTSLDATARVSLQPSVVSSSSTQVVVSRPAAASPLKYPPHHHHHDDQECEAYYDNRSDADDDVTKGTIKFPQHKLFGRDQELGLLENVINSLYLEEEEGAPSSSTASSSSSKIVWISGPSGAGKSALVEHELQKRLQESTSSASNRQICICRGKFDQGLLTREPFSALRQVLAALTSGSSSPGCCSKEVNCRIPIQEARATIATDSTPRLVHEQLDNLKSSFWQSPEANLLLEIFPVLKAVQERQGVVLARETLLRRSSADLVHVGRTLAAFLSGYCHRTCPLVVYLDDLQWADVASLEVLEALLSEDELLQHFLLIGSYRSEELDAYPRLKQFLDTINDKRESISIPVSTLAPRHVSDFLAATLNLRQSEIEPLTEVIYSKTLGNIFYCRQAVEELLRNNILYFDVVCFRWTFSLPSTEFNSSEPSSISTTTGGSGSRSEQQLLWSKSVVEMVQHKLELLSEMQKWALIQAAFIRYILDVPTLLYCLRAERYPNLEHAELVALLDASVDQGLLLKKKRQQTLSRGVGGKETDDSSPADAPYYYVFSHDRVQEAAYSLIPPGERRHRLLVQTAQALLGLASPDVVCDEDVKAPSCCNDSPASRPSDKLEWILYVAAEHLNRVPPEYLSNPVQVAQLNLRVATLSIAKASFDQAVRLLRAAVSAIYALPGAERLDRSTLARHRRQQWENHYDLLLCVTNHLIEAEFAQGNYAECKSSVEECLAYAKSDKDKCTAFFTKVDLAVRQERGKMFCLGVEESLRILAELGLRFPSHPTKTDLLGEKMRLQIALGTRSLSVVAALPIADEDWKFKLLGQLILISNHGGTYDLTAMVTLRALRLSLDEGITKYLPRMLTSYTMPLRKNGQLELAYSYAALVNRLYERFPGEKGGGEYAMGQTILYSGIVHIKEPFQDSLEKVLSLYRMNLATGNVDMALSAAMHFPLLFFASGLPLNVLVEPKLVLFQDKSRQLHRPGFEAIFMACRQFLRNLQGKMPFAHSSSQEMNPTELKGDIMDEDEIFGRMEGNSRNMTLRDFSMLRLGLACIFVDEQAMEAMMTKLSSYPLFDLPIVRQHLRLMFHGFASFYLGKKRGDQNLIKVGREIVRILQKLWNAGSSNVRPLLLSLRAMDCRKKILFDEAIASCSASHLMHLEAMMQEHCGRMLLEQRDGAEEGRSYLIQSMWLWADWGASTKVHCLKSEFEFLQNSPRKSRRNSSLHSMVMSKATQHGIVRERTNAADPVNVDF